MIAVGKRVKVRVVDPGRYSGNLAADVDGRYGWVDRQIEYQPLGEDALAMSCLVRFEIPLADIRHPSEPMERFWFPPSDLEAVPCAS